MTLMLILLILSVALQGLALWWAMAKTNQPIKIVITTDSPERDQLQCACDICKETPTTLAAWINEESPEKVVAALSPEQLN